MNKIREFISDYYKVGMTILNILLVASMPFNPDLKWDFFSYFSLISRLAFPLIILIFGNKGMWVFYFITSIIKTVDITFDDFTALSVTCILMLFVDNRHKWVKPIVMGTYIIDIFIAATLHGKNPYHLFAHFIGCLMLYLTVYKLTHKDMKTFKPNKRLELTNDERLILDELIKGKKQKEISQFSQNTVTEKLKQARKRNGIKHPEDLLDIYRELNI